MLSHLTGATRLHVIIGDPIAQVRAPAGVTRAFAERGQDAVLVPVQVAPSDLPDFLSVADRLVNLDGIIATIPHKFACYSHCASATDRARFVGASNVMRRRRDGGWYGDMTDGLGFVGAILAKGVDPAGKRALLVGAGGAGSAIGLSLIESGAHEVAVHDTDGGRRDTLIARLNELGKGRAVAGSASPAGYDIVANATPAGMREGDALPIDVSRLEPNTYCGCVVTKPEVSPFVAAARAAGCVTSTGTDMYHQQQDLIVDFLLHRDRGA